MDDLRGLFSEEFLERFNYLQKLVSDNKNSLDLIEKGNKNLRKELGELKHANENFEQKIHKNENDIDDNKNNEHELEDIDLDSSLDESKEIIVREDAMGSKGFKRYILKLLRSLGVVVLANDSIDVCSLANKCKNIYYKSKAFSEDNVVIKFANKRQRVTFCLAE